MSRHQAVLNRVGAERSLRPIQLPPLEEIPLVSILVSSHNYAEYIDECIESILRQSWEHFELIISDDGSTDRTAESVAAWAAADSRIRLLAGPNRGMTSALNAAWEASSGQIVCLLDADDTFLPDKLECVVRAFQSNERLGFVINRTIRTDVRGRHQGVSPLLQSGVSGWCAEEMLANGGVLPDIPPTSNQSFRREIGAYIFPLPLRFPGYGVMMLARIAPLLTEVLSLEQALATWRLHARNDSNRPRISDQHLEREIAVFEGAWQSQRDFLEAIASEAIERLQPVTQSEYYCRLRYALARRRGAADSCSLHRQLLASPGFSQRPLIDRSFWRIAPWLPTQLVSRAFDLTMTQGWIKGLIARVMRIGT
jgi:hypothetical protein